MIRKACRFLVRWIARAGLAVLLMLGMLYLGAIVVNAYDRKRDKAEQHAVWSAFLREFVNNNEGPPAAAQSPPCVTMVHAKTGGIIPEDSPVRSGFTRRLRLLAVVKPNRIFDNVSSETARNYALRNIWPEDIERRLDFGLPYEIIPALPAEWWNRGFCLGSYSFSAVGFNAARTEALFFANHHCSLCGWGGHVLMRKDGHQWRLVEGRTAWVS